MQYAGFARMAAGAGRRKSKDRFVALPVSLEFLDRASSKDISNTAHPSMATTKVH